MVTIGGIPVFDALITDEETGMMKISLVDDPAVMSNFQTFANRRMQMYSVADEDKRLVYGVVMRADFPIYRRDDRLGEYYILYKPETIRIMAEKYLADGKQNLVSTMHSTDVDGVQMVQYFIKDSSRGVSPAGFDEIADGSLFAEYHIVNDDVWAKVKDGTYKGFSLEGYFDLTPEDDLKEVSEIVEDLDGKFSSIFKQTILSISTMSKINRFKAALAKLLAVFGNVTTDKGVLAWDGEEDLKAGDAVFIEDQEGNRTDAPDGDYITSDNKTIVVVDGKVSEIKDPEAEVAPEEPAEEEAPEEAYGRVITDKYELVWEGEEDLKEGDEVFIEEAEAGLVPAPDGEYKTEDGKTIVVVEGKVAEIRDPEAEVAPDEAPAEPSAEEELRKENAELRSQVETLSKKVEELSRMPLAEPAHEEVRESVKAQRTGIKGLDRITELMSK